MRRTVLGMIAALVAAPVVGMEVAPARAAVKPTLVFTGIPNQDETRLAERFNLVADYLSKKLGIPVKYVPVKSYPAAVTAFENDEVQLAWFGGFTGVQARAAVPGSKAIAQGQEDTAFHSYFIVNAATGLKRSSTLDQGIAGKTFTFGSRSSTSGRVMPEYYIRKTFGKAPEQVFAKVGFSGDHTRTIQLVQSGAYAVGAVDYSVWNLEKKAGHIDESKVHVIWETPPFPDYNWTVRGDVDAKFGNGFTDRLQKELISIDDPKILEPFGRKKFIAADDAQYKPIKEVAQQAGLLNQ